MEKLWFCLAVVFFGAHAASAERVACAGMSERLQAIAKEDQADRGLPYDQIDWDKVTPRDLKRRIAVARIFAHGCLQSAADYAAAAIVYQHGDAADHAYQAFIWSKRGVDLGDSTQKWLLGAALDRYLVRTGQKQIFATQYGRPAGETCWCLEPVEKTFPDRLRSEFVNKNLPEAFTTLAQMNESLPGCKKTKYCATPLRPSPQGTVPGFW